jgi:hypothetical protein
MRRNDSNVIKAVAEAAGLPMDFFFVEEDHGTVLINHPDSMKWPRDLQKAVEVAATRVTGMKASIT